LAKEPSIIHCVVYPTKARSKKAEDRPVIDYRRRSWLARLKS